MTAKERILMLRLMEKAGKQPEFAKKLVIEATGLKSLRMKECNTGSLTKM